MEKEPLKYQKKIKQNQKLHRIYLSSLPSMIEDSEILFHFSKYGHIYEIDIVRDKEKGFCKGFGSITFSGLVDINKILIEDHIIYGRYINCEEFIDQKEKINKKKDEISKRKIFVSNIPNWMDNDALRERMSQFGCVTSAYKIQRFPSGKMMPYGYVCFETIEQANKCLRFGRLFTGSDSGYMIFEPFVGNKKERIGRKKEREGAFENSKLKSFKKGNYIQKQNLIDPTENIQQRHIPSFGTQFFVKKNPQALNQKKKSEKNDSQKEGKVTKKRIQEIEKIRRQNEFNQLTPTKKKYWEFSAKRNRYFSSPFEEEHIRLNKANESPND